MVELQQAWFVRVRDHAASHSGGGHGDSSFRDLASSMPQRIHSPRDFEGLPAGLAGVGVKLVHIDNFPMRKLDGCAVVVDETPVIGLTGRGRLLTKIFFLLLH